MIDLGDFLADKTIYIPFNTYDSDGASVTVTDLVAGDVKIHKNGGTTQRTSSAGITVSIDFDSITGNHLIAIDTSDNTDAGFYVTSADYQVRVEGVTVDTQTLNSWVGSFSIQNRYTRGTDIGNLNNFDPTSDTVARVTLTDTTTANTDMRGTDNAIKLSGTAGTSKAASNFVLTTGSQVNNFASTLERDGTYHELSDTAGTTLAYYVFDIGANTKPSSVMMYGRLESANDTIGVYCYDWAAVAWKQVGTVQGKDLSIDEEVGFTLYSSYVGSGGDEGKVHIMFYNLGLTSSTLYVDQIALSYVEVMRGTDSANTVVPPTEAQMNARTIPSADYLIASDTLARVTLVDTTTTNTDMVGTANAALASVCTETRLAELDAGNIPADLTSIKTDTGTNIPAQNSTTNANVGLVKTQTDKMAFTQTNKIDSTIDYVGANAVTTPDDFKADLTTLNDFDPTSDTVARVTLCDTNTDMLTVADIKAGITEGTLELDDILRIILSATAGKSAGGGSSTITFRDQADFKNRITATVDANNNRTAMSVDGT